MPKKEDDFKPLKYEYILCCCSDERDTRTSLFRLALKTDIVLFSISFLFGLVLIYSNSTLVSIGDVDCWAWTIWTIYVCLGVGLVPWGLYLHAKLKDTEDDGEFVTGEKAIPSVVQYFLWRKIYLNGFWPAFVSSTALSSIEHLDYNNNRTAGSSFRSLLIVVGFIIKIPHLMLLQGLTAGNTRNLYSSMVGEGDSEYDFPKYLR